MSKANRAEINNYHMSYRQRQDLSDRLSKEYLQKLKSKITEMPKEAHKDHEFEYVSVRYRGKHYITEYRCKICDVRCLVGKIFSGCWSYYKDNYDSDCLEDMSCSSLCVIDVLE